jgi:hypothetical protein
VRILGPRVGVEIEKDACREALFFAQQAEQDVLGQTDPEESHSETVTPWGKRGDAGHRIATMTSMSGSAVRYLDATRAIGRAGRSGSSSRAESAGEPDCGLVEA